MKPIDVIRKEIPRVICDDFEPDPWKKLKEQTLELAVIQAIEILNSAPIKKVDDPIANLHRAAERLSIIRHFKSLLKNPSK